MKKQKKSPPYNPLIVIGVILVLIAVGLFFVKNKPDSSAQNKKADFRVERMDLYNISLSIPETWTFAETNRRPEPTEVPYIPTVGHDCSDYTIANEDRSLIILIQPFCGFGEALGGPLSEDYVTVKELGNDTIIARFQPSEDIFSYAYAGPTQISDEKGTRTVLFESGAMTFGEGDKKVFMHITLTAHGLGENKESQLSLADQVIASMEMN